MTKCEDDVEVSPGSTLSLSETERENILPSVEMQKQPGGTDTGNRKRNTRADQVNNLEEKLSSSSVLHLKPSLDKTPGGCSHSLLQMCKMKLMNGHGLVCAVL